MHRDLFRVAEQIHRQGQRLSSPGRQQAYLRRAVSTAYYALFHLLSFEAASLARGPHTLALKRGFQHGQMLNASRAMLPRAGSKPANPPGVDLVPVKNVSHGVQVPREVSNVAWFFMTLQGMRHEADYNSVQPVTVGQANDAIDYMRSAFAYWRVARTSDAARLYLALLSTWNEI
jgi:hypothetical protein